MQFPLSRGTCSLSNCSWSPFRGEGLCRWRAQAAEAAAGLLPHVLQLITDTEQQGLLLPTCSEECLLLLCSCSCSIDRVWEAPLETVRGAESDASAWSLLSSAPRRPSLTGSRLLMAGLVAHSSNCCESCRGHHVRLCAGASSFGDARTLCCSEETGGIGATGNRLSQFCVPGMGSAAVCPPRST